MFVDVVIWMLTVDWAAATINWRTVDCEWVRSAGSARAAFDVLPSKVSDYWLKRRSKRNKRMHIEARGFRRRDLVGKECVEEKRKWSSLLLHGRLMRAEWFPNSMDGDVGTKLDTNRLAKR